LWGKVDGILCEENLQFIVIFFFSAIQFYAWISEECVTQALPLRDITGKGFDSVIYPVFNIEDQRTSHSR
jgi:hypothetical protein